MKTDKIYLPWRAFKAFVQLLDYDGQGGIPISELDRLILKEPYRYRTQLLARSQKAAGDKVRAILLRHQLIRIGTDKQPEVVRGLPLGREYLVGQQLDNDPMILPQPRSDKGLAWIQALGRCSYCGDALSFFGRLALGGYERDLGRRLLACRSCHGMRGIRKINDLRFIVRMDRFEAKYKLRFTRDQYDFLSGMGCDLGLGDYQFWFEKVDQQVVTNLLNSAKQARHLPTPKGT